LQISDSVYEVQALDRHDQVDGIEVFLAAKASGQIGPGIDRGVELAADRTEESEPSLADFRRDLQIVLYQPVDRYRVAQPEQFVACKSFFHRIPPGFFVVFSSGEDVFFKFASEIGPRFLRIDRKNGSEGENEAEYPTRRPVALSLYACSDGVLKYRHPFFSSRGKVRDGDDDFRRYYGSFCLFRSRGTAVGGGACTADILPCGTTPRSRPVRASSFGIFRIRLCTTGI
jgi:hypothetical protein